MPDSEAEVKLEFEKGDNVTINEGPFASYEGTVDEVLLSVASSVCWSPSLAVKLQWNWSTGKLPSPGPTKIDLWPLQLLESHCMLLAFLLSAPPVIPYVAEPPVVDGLRDDSA